MHGENELAYTLEAALRSSYFQQPQHEIRVADWVPRKRLHCSKPQLEVQQRVTEDFERQQHNRKIRRWAERLQQSETNVAVADSLTLEDRFHEQAEKWDHETAHLSSPAQRFLHPSYVAIMGMAQDNRDEVIDLLLRDMRDNHREWFWALSYLTHQNPIDRRDSGKLDKMIQAWVRWGKQEGRL